MEPKYLWAVGAGAVALILLGAKRASAPSGVSSDTEALTRMLITETGFNRNPDEMAQIVWVAVNRARRSGLSLRETVEPPGMPLWNNGAVYRKRYNEATRNTLWPKARAFVEDVVSGRSYPNRGATHFVHPSGMPTPPCADNRVALSTIAGTRCMPTWIAQGKVVGGAMFA